ncbi:hypothetical protein [Parafilimonas terrae]|jgi:hypothetical protein|uniref:Uncharacterized protein n=1 Tax=Parafilimonas terrae TaxID=1465490 RepID=A0A1I5WIU1_9BACT|nr:hypothetical protein [Parafilimonas terrae]SFQ19635.1 hypothetical protein SAMN05444277_106220 [Parafilimonas terrae]
MSHDTNISEYKDKEFGYNWVNSSRFLFYLQVLCLIALFTGMSYYLYTYRYKGKPDVEIPANTLYTPQYK